MMALMYISLSFTVMSFEFSPQGIGFHPHLHARRIEYGAKQYISAGC